MSLQCDLALEQRMVKHWRDREAFPVQRVEQTKYRERPSHHRRILEAERESTFELPKAKMVKQVLHSGNQQTDGLLILLILHHLAKRGSLFADSLYSISK